MQCIIGSIRPQVGSAIKFVFAAAKHLLVWCISTPDTLRQYSIWRATAGVALQGLQDLTSTLHSQKTAAQRFNGVAEPTLLCHMQS